MKKTELVTGILRRRKCGKASVFSSRSKVTWTCVAGNLVREGAEKSMQPIIFHCQQKLFRTTGKHLGRKRRDDFGDVSVCSA